MHWRRSIVVSGDLAPRLCGYSEIGIPWRVVQHNVWGDVGLIPLIVNYRDITIFVIQEITTSKSLNLLCVKRYSHRYFDDLILKSHNNVNLKNFFDRSISSFLHWNRLLNNYICNTSVYFKFKKRKKNTHTQNVFSFFLMKKSRLTSSCMKSSKDELDRYRENGQRCTNRTNNPKRILNFKNRSLAKRFLKVRRILILPKNILWVSDKIK